MSTGKVEVSAPVLVYERPRFTEPMFVKARDAPLKPKKKDLPDIPTSVRTKTQTTNVLKKQSSAVTTEGFEKPTLLRKLSRRARSLSGVLFDTSDSSLMTDVSRNRSLSVRVSRRFSSMLRRRKSSSSSPSGKLRQDELIVFVDEGKNGALCN